MSDERLRALERRWRETGDVADEAAWLAERARMGDLAPARLALAARCGHPAARVAVGAAVEHDPRWLEGVEAWPTLEPYGPVAAGLLDGIADRLRAFAGGDALTLVDRARDLLAVPDPEALYEVRARLRDVEHATATSPRRRVVEAAGELVWFGVRWAHTVRARRRGEEPPPGTDLGASAAKELRERLEGCAAAVITGPVMIAFGLAPSQDQVAGARLELERRARARLARWLLG